MARFITVETNLGPQRINLAHFVRSYVKSAAGHATIVLNETDSVHVSQHLQTTMTDYELLDAMMAGVSLDTNDKGEG